jgi:hypothetical protein
LLDREALPHALAGAVDRLAVDQAVGPREVDVLEDAEPRHRLDVEAVAGQSALVDHHDLAGLDVAHVLGLDQVEGAGLRRQDVGVLPPSDHQRAKPVGIAHADQLAVGQEHQRVRAGDLAQGGDQPGHRIELRDLGHQVDDALGVAGGLEDRASGLEAGAQLVGVDQVAVVGDGDRAARVVEQERLGVAQLGAAGGRVAGVADGRAPGQAGQGLLVEDVGDQAHADVAAQALVAGDQPGGLLAAVLQGVQAQVGQVGGLVVTMDAEDATHGPSGTTRPKRCHPGGRGGDRRRSNRRNLVPGPDLPDNGAQ